MEYIYGPLTLNQGSNSYLLDASFYADFTAILLIDMCSGCSGYEIGRGPTCPHTI